MRAKILDESDLSRVLATADAQETVMILSTHRAGLRAMEAAALDWRWLRDGVGGLADFIDLPALATKGRTGAGRLPIPADLRRALLRLSALRRHPARGPVLLSATGGRLTAAAVTQRLRRLYAAAGVDATSHSGRRTFITSLAGKGLNAFSVQRAARHAHISTTRLYVDDAVSDAAAAQAILSLGR